MTRHLITICLPLLLTACKEPPIAAAMSSMAGEEPAGPSSKLTKPPARKPVELTWFKGVGELPADHPCHDSTQVVVFSDQEKGGPAPSAVSTLGELRKDPTTDWVHFGPRTVQGVRWSSPAGDFLVASCVMGGSGYRAYDPSRDEAIASGKPTFVLGDVGEPNHIEYAEVRWMHRARDEPWTTMRETVLWAGDDEGNDPQFTSRARVLRATDADGDGMPEITAFTVADCHDFTDKRCPGSDGRMPSFWVDIIATEGKLGIHEVVLLSHELAEVSSEPELVSAMPPEVHAQLSMAIARERSKVLELARSVLRDAGKVR